MFEVHLHECKLFIILKSPNIFGLHDRVRHQRIFTLLIEDVINSLNFLIRNIPWKFKKYGVNAVVRQTDFPSSVLPKILIKCSSSVSLDSHVSAWKTTILLVV